MNFSASLSSIIIVESALRELLRDGKGRAVEVVGKKLSASGDRGEPGFVADGLVPARCLGVMSCEGVCAVTTKGCLPWPRSCAADKEGRRRRRGATDPLIFGNEVRSSPFTDGPEETGVLSSTADSTVLASVDPLPLRFRRMYASMALASCSSTRDAIGDSADAGLETEDKSELLEYERAGVGEEARNVPVLFDEASDRYVC